MDKFSKKGQKDIVSLMILNKDTNFNKGLAGACRGGHIDIINMILSLDKLCGIIKCMFRRPLYSC